MPSSWSHTPNRGLQIASGLAQGLQSGLNAFQNAQARNQQLELQRMKLQGDAELRKLQLEKLRQEMAPVEFSAQKFQTISNAVELGIIPETMKTQAAKDLMEMADTPQKLQFLNSAIDRKKQADLKKLSSSNMAEMFGSGTQVMDVPEAPVQTEQAAPQANPAASLRLTPKEAELYGGLLKSKLGAQTQFAGIQQRDAASERQLIASLANYETRLDAAKDSNETKKIVQELRNELGLYQTNANNQNRIQVQGLRNEGDLNTQRMRNRGTFDAQDMRNKGALAVEELRGKNRIGVAELNAKSREKTAAMKKAAGGRGNPVSPEQKMALDIIKQKEKALSDLNKPSSGLNMELPQEKIQRIKNANADLARAYEQYKAQFGVDLRGKSSETKAAPQGKAPAVVPQGNARPKFTKGPGVSAQIAKLKEGTEFEVDGQVYELKGGKAVPK